MGGTGTFKVLELTSDDPNTGLQKGQKYIECITPGYLLFQNMYAYGTSEFFLSTASNSRSNIYTIIDKSNFSGNDNSYIYQIRGVGIAVPGRIRLFRRDNGTAKLLNDTANNYVDDSWYGYKYTRTTDGKFTFNIKGGSFGNTYQLVDLTGGSGTNPITDNTYTESKYIIADLDAGDMFIP